MLRLLPVLLMAGLSLCVGLVAAQKAGPAKPSATKNTKQVPAAAKSGKAKNAKATTVAKGKSKSKKAIVPTRAVVQHPSSERYMEIQQALSDRGYATEVSGTWGVESTEALKRFQKAQNIPVDGKLGALSLTALGLGPRRTTGGLTATMAQNSEASTAESTGP
ncbi:MAG: peptidoglycan-binding domain-containing protein [Acidobacteriota bacterium]